VYGFVAMGSRYFWWLREWLGVHAYRKHPLLLLPSGPDKVWALRSRRSEPHIIIASILQNGKEHLSLDLFREYPHPVIA